MISPTEDYCAKVILENDIVRKYFICAVLSIQVEKIKITKIINPFLYKFSKKDKEGIVDVLVELEDGTKIDIEIQVKCQKAWDKRSVFYLSKLFIKGFRARSSYEKLTKCVNISILEHNYLASNKSHTIFRLRDEEGKDYTDVIEMHIIELEKLQDEKDQFSEQKK